MGKENETRLYSRLMNMSDEEEVEFREYLVDLDNLGNLADLHPSASGSIKASMDKGVRSISKKQIEVISRGLNTYFYIHECEICTEEIKWNEMIEAIDTKRCSGCNYKLEKENIEI